MISGSLKASVYAFRLGSIGHSSTRPALTADGLLNEFATM